MPIENAVMIIGEPLLRKNLFEAFRDEQTKNHKFPPPEQQIETDGVIVDSAYTSASQEEDFEDTNYQLLHAGSEASVDKRDLLKPYFTLIVCVNSENYELCKKQIDDIMKLRSSTNGDPIYFNILPVYTDNACTNALIQLRDDYPTLCKTAVKVNLDADDFSSLLRTSLDLSKATPIYHRILTTAVYLDNLKERLNASEITDLDSTIDSLATILMLGATKLAGQDENNFLKKYFDNNKKEIAEAVVALHDKIPARFTYENRNKNIFLNVIKSIGIIFAMLSIVGIPFAFQQMSQNLKQHNHFFKFNATTDAEEAQEQLSKLENKINRFLS